MSQINVLDFQVANLIAAGEVVDRPGSVVKELIENSIDAGATSVTCEIRNGGCSFIRITDDGCGMEHDDVPMALKRHATSKISSADDLDSIMTLGFRGEALAAISSVSKVKIFTKRIDDEMGTILSCEGPDIIEYSETGCRNGTTIIIEELFYNVPARRKFLKKDASETLYVSAVMERMALSRPGIRFTYIVDNQTKFTTPGTGKLIDCIYAVMGKEFVSKSVPVSADDDTIRISGYIGTPELTRGSTNSQLFFINHRFVKCKTAYAAIKQAFDSYIPSGKFAMCVINIDIDPKRVDVNVHPSKLEVKFANERAVFDVIYYAVRSALVKGLPTPNISSPAKKDMVNVFSPVIDRSTPKPAQIKIDSISNAKSVPAPTQISKPIEKIIALQVKSVALDKEDEKSSVISKPAPLRENKNDFGWDEIIKKTEVIDDLRPLPDYKIIGEAFYSYVIVELEDKILFIDKHAAHERIIFEEMKRNMHKSAIETQMFMMPIEVCLDKESYSAVKEHADEIKSTGIEFDFDDDNTKVLVCGTPSIIALEDVIAFIEALGNSLSNGAVSTGISSAILFEKALYQASCKAAIKAGRIYDASEIKWICDKLLVLPNIKYCPHGRPVAFEMKRTELERQFKRI